MRDWIDVTVAIRAGMISWPTDPAVEISEYKTIQQGNSSNVLFLKFGAHTGTHIDAPRHFFDQGMSIDKMPVDMMVGPVRVIEIKDPLAITVAELKLKRIRPGQRIFFRTRNSTKKWWKKSFNRDYVAMTPAAADYLVFRKVKLVGIDSLSIGAFHGPAGKAVHKTLLSSRIWIVEGLNLFRASEGNYLMFCLPLRIEGGDGAPTRVFLRKKR